MAPSGHRPGPRIPVRVVREGGPAGEQMEAAARGVAAADDAFRQARTRREAGAGLLVELLGAEVELVRARVAEADARVAHNRAQYALLRAIGGAVGVAAAP